MFRPPRLWFSPRVTAYSAEKRPQKSWIFVLDEFSIEGGIKNAASIEGVGGGIILQKFEDFWKGIKICEEVPVRLPHVWFCPRKDEWSTIRRPVRTIRELLAMKMTY